MWDENREWTKEPWSFFLHIYKVAPHFWWNAWSSFPPNAFGLLGQPWHMCHGQKFVIVIICNYGVWSSHHHERDSSYYIIVQYNSRWMGWWSSLIWFTGWKWIYTRSNGKEYDVYQFSPFSITDSRRFQGKIGLVATSCSKTLRRRPGRCAGRFLSQHQGFT